MLYDLIIIGGGPAGISAGVYAARKKIKTALIAEEIGGQSLVSADIRNWIGTKSLSGYELAQNLEGHLRDQKDIDIISGEKVLKIEKSDSGFTLKTTSGKSLESRYLLITSGSRRKKLDVPGEKEHEGVGVAYCSICDAPIFQDKTVAVIGGGNAGLEAVIDLITYATKVYLLVRGPELKGDAITQEKIKKEPKVEVIYNAQTLEILGEKMVSGLKYQDLKNNQEKILELEGVFIEIGILPNSEIVQGLVEVDPRGRIIVDHKTQRTSAPGIWAAGDVTDVLYNQNNISSGDAIKAVLNIYETLTKS